MCRTPPSCRLRHQWLGDVLPSRLARTAAAYQALFRPRLPSHRPSEAVNRSTSLRGADPSSMPPRGCFASHQQYQSEATSSRHPPRSCLPSLLRRGPLLFRHGLISGSLSLPLSIEAWITVRERETAIGLGRREPGRGCWRLDACRIGVQKKGQTLSGRRKSIVECEVEGEV